MSKFVKIILRHCLASGNFTTHGIDIADNADISLLNQKILEKFGIAKNQQILHFKRDGVTLKLISGWTLSHYEIKDRAIVYLEKLETQKEDDDDNDYVPLVLSLLVTQYKQRIYTSKGDYFARLGILAKVDEENEEEEGCDLSRKPSNLTNYINYQKLSDTTSSKGSRSLSDTILSTEDDSLSRKGQSEGYRLKYKEAQDCLIKEVKANNIQNVKALLVKNEEEDYFGKLINAKNYGGWSALHWAVYLGYSEIVYELTEKGADINTVTEDGWTCLQLAVHTNHLEVVKTLTRDSLKIDLNKLTRRMTALHIAVKNDKPETVALLLERGADYKVTNEQGILPLDQAKSDKVRQLIASRAKKLALEEFHPPKPPIVRGYMFIRGDYLFRMSKRYFVLNPEEGTFIRYSSRNDYPDKPTEIIPLKSIEGVRRMKAGRFNDKSFSYIQLLHQRRHVLACYDEQIANQWVTFIIQGTVYSNLLEENIKKEMANSSHDGNTENNLVTYFNKITEEIELDDLPPEKNGINIRSLSFAHNSESTCDKRLSNSFQEKSSELSNQPIKEVQEKAEDPSTIVEEEEEDLMLDTVEDKVNFESFQILKVLGSGSFGKVFKVRKKDTNKIYAIKALRKRALILKNQLKYAVIEANVLKVTDSPFILKLHYAFQTPQYLYLILDYCPGGDLSLHILKKGSFSEEETRFYIAELILAIEHLHSKDIIYRDLKPENILIGNDGHIKLADFGLSKEGITGNHVAKSFCGSPAYLSPDMLKKQGVGKAADIYGIGAVMYEMLIGESPFYSQDMQKMYVNIQRGNLQIPKKLSDTARHLLKKLLSTDPNQRPGVRNKYELRSHPFFEGVNWKKLEKKEITPPYLEPLDKDEIETSLNTTYPFTDMDYVEANQYSNRVKNFTFVKTQR